MRVMCHLVGITCQHLTGICCSKIIVGLGFRPFRLGLVLFFGWKGIGRLGLMKYCISAFEQMCCLFSKFSYSVVECTEF